MSTDFGKHRQPEILAPAGTYEAMEAAVKAGCDAVYAGGSLFSARAYAGNFDEESFLKAIDYCHLFGVKVYMTLNTLLKEEEIGRIRSYIEPYYLAGLDAVLVQDMGVLKILKDHFPDLPVHASTQMSITSSYGAELAKELGFERIVPARELSLEEIISIKEQVDIEIETFVHGAMCFSYSGRCLFSSFAGGRSGNRGRCAQPCRQCYTLSANEQEYMLSLKDMCMLEELPLLIDAGIDSFKIEGRMKNPYYVAAVVSAYRSARDLYLDLKAEEQADSWEKLSDFAKSKYVSGICQDTDDLKDLYNRGGFHSGYYYTEKGKEMLALDRPNHQGMKIGIVTGIRPPKVRIQLEKDFHPGDVVEIRKAGGRGSLASSKEIVELTGNVSGKAGGIVTLNGKEFKKISPGMEVWRTRNEQLLKRIEQEILDLEPAVPVSALVRAKVGEPLQIMLTAALPKQQEDPFFIDADSEYEEVSLCVQGEPVEEASGKPVTAKILTEKMKKTGGSSVRIISVQCDVDENAFVPMSSLNSLRREAIEDIKKEITGSYRRVQTWQEENTGE